MIEKSKAISVAHLKINYGKFVAIDDVSFNVFYNEIFGLLGPNGAGKTSIIRVLTTSLKPTRGTVIVDGNSVAKHAREIRSFIGIVPESFALYDYLTARENLQFFSRPYSISEERRKKNIEKITASLAIQERLNDKIITFSSGMKRKISIACAIIHDPTFLFMDEPTIGLDPKIRRTIWDLLFELKKRMTILITTHYLEEAEEVCDRVAIINEGRITAQGNPIELKQSQNVQSLEEVFMKSTGM